MQGKRVWPTTEGYIPAGRMSEKGTFGRISEEICPGYERQHWWQVTAPDGSQCSLNPAIHTITEHDDGTITVNPSIVTATWHGWLRLGNWESA